MPSLLVLTDLVYLIALYNIIIYSLLTFSHAALKKIIDAIRWVAWGLFYYSQFKSFFSLDGINVSLDHETFVMADVMSIIKTNSLPLSDR